MVLFETDNNEFDTVTYGGQLEIFIGICESKLQADNMRWTPYLTVSNSNLEIWMKTLILSNILEKIGNRILNII